MDISFGNSRIIGLIGFGLGLVLLMMLYHVVADTDIDCAQRLKTLTAASISAADLPCTSPEKNLPRDAELQFNIGEIYQFGKGVPADNSVAFQWYMKAAQQGYAVAENSVGLFYQDGLGVPQNYANALAWFHKAADAGTGWAEGNIGIMYQNGWGVTKDQHQALEWQMKAASHGVGGAAYNVGLAYHTGAGVPQDYKTAAEWFHRGAASGDANSQFMLGDYYAEGKGVGRNYFEAGKWLDLAARQGFREAKDYLAKLHGLCFPQSTKDKSDAYSCMIDAMTGNARAEVAVGNFYHGGTFVPQDGATAAQWYRKAAVQGDPMAQMMLARMFDKGEGVPVDEAESYAWLAVAESDKVSERDRATVEPFRNLIPTLKLAIGHKMDAETLKHAQARANEYIEKYATK